MPRVIHEHIDPAKLIQGDLDQLDRRFCSSVTSHRTARASFPQGFDLLDRLIDRSGQLLVFHLCSRPQPPRERLLSRNRAQSPFPTPGLAPGPQWQTLSFSFILFLPTVFKVFCSMPVAAPFSSSARILFKNFPRTALGQTPP